MNPAWVAFGMGVFVGLCAGVLVMCVLGITKCNGCILLREERGNSE
jgi:hypothetical protein